MARARQASTTPGTARSLPRATVRETLRVTAGVLLPLIAQGAVIRRPLMTRWAARLDTDRRGAAVLRRLRHRYGPGPLRLRVPGRSVALVLEPAHVRRLLDGSPDPFTPASREKVAALRHFQPHGVLISRGETRTRRREVNEAVLEPDHPMHRFSAHIARSVADEVRRLTQRFDRGAVLTWDAFGPAHARLTRRIVLGERAGGDQEITRLLNRLRADGNWAYLHPRRRATRERFDTMVRRYVQEAQPNSLVELVAAMPADHDVDPEGQVPHWMFAFDAAGIAAFRTLALLAWHPAYEHRVLAEMAGGSEERPLMRACVEESLRLWPTTLVILRDSTQPTVWPTGDEDGVTSGGTSFIIVSTFFHRDGETLEYANQFVPEIWLDGRGRAQPGLVPFSAGPARCPGRDLVLLVASTVVATILSGHTLDVLRPSLDPAQLPHSLDHASLRLALTRRPT